MKKRIRGRWRAAIIYMALATTVGAISSNFTEPFLLNPAQRFMHFLRFGRLQEHETDARGVPWLRYNRLGDQLYKNPVYTAVYALYYYDCWNGNGQYAYFWRYYKIYPPKVKTRSEWRRYFLAAADTLIQDMKIYSRGGLSYGVYEYDFPWEVYHLQPPWRSAMAQGLAIQVLALAWQHTHDERYRKAAELALNALMIEVPNGGVTYKISNDAWWYEEYASPSAIPSYVLNGMLHVLIALQEYYAITRDPKAHTLYLKGARAVSLKVSQYTNRSMRWTNYDLLGTPANYKYHMINVNLMCRLHALTGDPAFALWQEWAAYTTPFLLREFVYQRPNYSDVMLLLINIGIAFPGVALAGWLVSKINIFRRFPGATLSQRSHETATTDG